MNTYDAGGSRDKQCVYSYTWRWCLQYNIWWKQFYVNLWCFIMVVSSLILSGLIILQISGLFFGALEPSCLNIWEEILKDMDEIQQQRD